MLYITNVMESSEITKSLEKTLDLLRERFKYTEDSVKQIEDKSKSQAIQVSAIFAFSVAIVKPTDVIKKFSEMTFHPIWSNIFFILILITLVVIIISLTFAYYTSSQTTSPTDYKLPAVLWIASSVKECESYDHFLDTHGDALTKTISAIQKSTDKKSELIKLQYKYGTTSIISTCAYVLMSGVFLI